MNESFPVVWIICAFVGLAIGKPKGKSVEGFFLGLIPGLLGIIIIAVTKPANNALANQAYVGQ